MKTYALRMEQTEHVLAALNVAGLSHAQLQTAYDAFLGALIDALRSCCSEQARIETHQFQQLEHAKAAMLRPDLPYVNFDSQSALGTPLGVSPVLC